MKRTGFISIVGRPNVGKSTLLNSILGEKIAIVSNKPQTTRNRIAGIETRGEDQFVFLDTPGIFKPQNSLGDFMVKTANSTMQDSSVLNLSTEKFLSSMDIEPWILHGLYFLLKIPGLGTSLGKGDGNHLKNSLDRGAWQVIVHGVAKRQT